jgi:hypothetical protein
MVLQEGDAFQDAQVWKSYSDAVGKHAIRSIPFFTFHGPETNAGGGKFPNDGGNCE